MKHLNSCTDEDVLETSDYDDCIQDIILQLTNEINVLSSHYPDINFDNVSCNIAKLLNNLESLKRDYDTQTEVLNSSIHDLETVSEKLVLEKNHRRFERERSLEMEDLIENKNRSLVSKVGALHLAIKERDAQITSIMAENEHLLKRVANFESSNKALLSTVTDLNSKLKSVKNEHSILSTKNCDMRKWVDDNLINSYFEEMAKSTNNDKCVFYGPSVTHSLKLGTKEMVSDILSSSSFFQHNYAFFCLNNSLDMCKGDSGNHWSLVFFDCKRKKAFHLDSLSGSNKDSAIKLIKNLDINCTECIELDCMQQKNNFECGFNVVLNAMFLVKHYCIPNYLMPFEEWYNCDLVNRSGPQAVTLIPNDVGNKTLSKASQNDVVSSLNAKSINNETWKLVKRKKVSHSTSQAFERQYFLSKNPFEVLSKADQKNDELESELPGSDKTRPTLRSRSKRRVKRNPLKKKTKKSGWVVSSSDHSNVMSFNRPNNVLSSNKFDVTSIVSPKCATNVTETLNHNSVVSNKTKIRMLADSHGRRFANLLHSKYYGKCNVLVDFKPNATLIDVIDGFECVVKDMNLNDCLLVFGGTNDIVNEHCNSDLVGIFKKLLEGTKHTKVILLGLPYRFDKPYLNRSISKINHEVSNLVEAYNHCTYLPLDSLKKMFFTRFGLHLNLAGKKQILSMIDSMLFPTHEIIGISKIPVIIGNRPHSRPTSHQRWSNLTSSLKRIHVIEGENTQKHFLGIMDPLEKGT